MLAVSAVVLADGKSGITGDGEDAGVRATAISEVAPAVRDGGAAGVCAAVVSAVEPAGGGGGVAGDDGVWAELRPPGDEITRYEDRGGGI